MNDTAAGDYSDQPGEVFQGSSTQCEEDRKNGPTSRKSLTQYEPFPKATDANIDTVKLNDFSWRCHPNLDWDSIGVRSFLPHLAASLIQNTQRFLVLYSRRCTF
jgi:hypothetical protein